MKKTVVLYPGLAASHFVPMMQLADALLEAGYSVTVALIDITMERNVALAAAVDRCVSSRPSVTFHTLPRIQDPPVIALDVQLLLGYFELLRLYNDHFHGFLLTMPPQSIHAVIMDSLSAGALDVTGELGIPAYTFFAANASAFAVFLQLPSIRSENQPSFKEMGDTPLNLQGVHPIPASHLSAEMLENPNSDIYKATLKMQGRNAEANGILVNTVASLEARALGALKGQKFLHGSEECMMPPVYCVGPLVEGASKMKEKHGCLEWLDKQPEHSVVFLCFGSVGFASHSVEQVKEIAVGLESSGHRFLWVLRPPLISDKPEGYTNNQVDPDLDVLLPRGFLERTKGRGLVVKKWAPQVDVLHHRATGAFVTHCGWNSVLEAITAGVPMLCWPLYAEQKMNKVFMVEEFGVGIEVVGWQQGLVKANELEAKVRLVMESEEGARLRARVAEHRDAAAAAWKDGGSSRVAFGQFLSDAGNVGMGQTRA
ncbi:hypothetical protein ACP4OV_020315 [Aristida adscensionis]